MPLKIIKFDQPPKIPDQKIPGLGYISRNGENFLPAIVRLEEILSGRRK